MSSPARKLARQNKRNSPEGKEEIKKEKIERQGGPLAPQTVQSNSPAAAGYQPEMQIRQRRAGNS